ncbi:Glutathione peroxidase [Trichoplax sp. H2]|nr:Glutathione peroxidase [Trichoplax sp. H2]|eukprot:RDD39738.1 Glutathione peroxidase [Trichoplax sp. H2]
MSSSCTLSVEQAEDIAKRLRGSSGISIKDRIYHFRTYAKCFIGSEAVDWFVKENLADDRKEAIKVGQQILDTGIIHHVVDDHNFKDGYLFYRFKEDDPPNSNTGPSAKTVTGECGSYSMYMERKGMFMNSRSFYVVAPSQEFLFKYGSELDPYPKRAFPLKEMTVASVTSNDDTAIEITFDEGSQYQDMMLLVPNENDQLAWMKKLEAMGVKIGRSKEEINEEIGKSPNIYPFKANTIDGDEISLEKYNVFLRANGKELHSTAATARAEPKSNAEIKEFAEKNFNAEFQLFSKIKVNGSEALPLYKYLKSRLPGTLGNFIKWNFSKFLCNKEGVPVQRYSPTVAPLEIEETIKELLK